MSVVRPGTIGGAAAPALGCSRRPQASRAGTPRRRSHALVRWSTVVRRCCRWLVAVRRVACCVALLQLLRADARCAAEYARFPDGGDFFTELSNPRPPDLDADELHDLQCPDCKDTVNHDDDDDDNYRHGRGAGRVGGGDGRGLTSTTRLYRDGRLIGKKRDHRQRIIESRGTSRHTTATTDITTISEAEPSVQSTRDTEAAATTNRVFNVRWNCVIVKTTELP